MGRTLHYRSANAKGFTRVKLMIVVTIISILAAIIALQFLWHPIRPKWVMSWA